MLLSISIITNGTSKYIEKCLDSLENLRKAVSSELIVVDTGCDEASRKLFEKYADTIIDFPWVGDFAAARNVGLKECSGQWFMFLDDDEWIEDDADIIKFFTSGEYKNYNQALYTQRNYDDYGLTSYSDAWVLRMMKLTDQVHFEGRIHECLVPVKPGNKMLDLKVGHLGYIKINEVVWRAKSLRNVSLLSKEIEANPFNMHNWIQLAQEFDSIEDSKNTYDTCTTALNLIATGNCKDDITAVKGQLMCGQIISLMKMDNLTEALKLVESYSSTTKAADAKIAVYGLNIEHTLGCYKEAIEYGQKYLDSYEYLQKHQEDFAAAGSIFISDLLEDRRYNISLARLADSGMHLDNWDYMRNYLNWLSKPVHKNQEFQGYLLNTLVDLANNKPVMTLNGIKQLININADFDDMFSDMITKLTSIVGDKPILSINMLCSGRNETTKKCLDSLKPLRDCINTELIITDTGCDKNMRSLIESYADKVIDYTWTNNFGAARNVGLKASCGQWYMYIDDDEWFLDLTEMIVFFRAGEYKKYTECYYIQRNYNDYEATSYVDAWIGRMCRLTPETHFEGRIHEYLWPVEGHPKSVNCPVAHFGYVRTDKSDNDRGNRNITLLLEEIAEHPDMIRWWAQLAQEYASEHDNEKLLELCDRGIKRFANLKEGYDNSAGGTLYLGAILACARLGDYEKAREYVELSMADSRNTLTTAAKTQVYACDIYNRLGHHNLAVECANRYEKMAEILKNNPTEFGMGGMIFTGDTLSPEVAAFVQAQKEDL